MKRISYLLMIILAVVFVSCSKDGSEGPLGPRGERGEQGIQGAQGIPGTDGNMIIHGAGAPKSTDGEPGDFYIDKASSNLYGPKAANGWGAATSLKGAKGDTGSKGDKGATGAKGDTGSKGDKGATGDKGDTGAKGDKGATGDKGDTGAKGLDGSQFLSGTAVPTTQGKVGDFYFRTSTVTLYGPKTPSGWGTGISLKGDKGDKGEKGDKGDKGDTGNADVKTYSFEINPNDWESTNFYGANAKWNRYMVDAALTGGGDIRHTGSYATIAYVETFFDGAPYSRSKSILPHTETFDTYAINFELDLKNAWILMSKTTNGIDKLEVPMGERPDKVIIEIVRIKTERVNLLKGKLDFNDYNAVAKHFGLK